MNSDLVVVEGTQFAIGQAYDRELVVEFGETLMGIHPGATDVGEVGMRAVAQLALMTGANPLPGTNGIHTWKDNKGKICIQFGIGFLRGEVEKAGGSIWAERPRPMTDDERATHELEAGQIGAICKAALKRDVFSLMSEARANGVTISFAMAKNEVLRVGTGTAGKQERSKNGRSHLWSALERAERDLIRKLVPIMMGRAQANATSGTRVNGGLDWSVNEFAHTSHESPGFSLDETNSLLFDAEPEVEEVIEGVIESDVTESSDNEEEKAPQDVDDSRGKNSPQAQQERESERPSAEPEAMTSDERVVYDAAKNFVPTAVRTIARYEHSKAVKAVAKLLGHDTVPKDGAERVKLFRQIGEYAKMRDGDMDSEAAVDLIVNE